MGTERHLAALVAIAASVGFLGAAGAAKADTREVGVYTPRVFIGDTSARADYARRVAVALSAAVGHELHGRTFARRVDLDGFITAGQLGLVLVDPLVAVARPDLLEPIAVGTGPEGTRPLVVAVSHRAARGLGSFAGLRLATVDVDVKERWLVQNLLLEGVVALDAHLGGLVGLADVAELGTTLTARQAGVGLAYRAQVAALGVEIVAELAGVALPVLCAVKGRVDEATIASLRRAITQGLAWPAAGPFQRLTLSVASALRPLTVAVNQGASGPPLEPLLWSPAPVVRLPVTGFLPTPNVPIPVPPTGARWQLPAFVEPK